MICSMSVRCPAVSASTASPDDMIRDLRLASCTESYYIHALHLASKLLDCDVVQCLCCRWSVANSGNPKLQPSEASPAQTQTQQQPEVLPELMPQQDRERAATAPKVSSMLLWVLWTGMLGTAAMRCMQLLAAAAR